MIGRGAINYGAINYGAINGDRGDLIEMEAAAITIALDSVVEVSLEIALTCGYDIAVDSDLYLNLIQMFGGQTDIVIDSACQFDRTFFSKWNERYRVIVHKQNRGVRVEKENRTFAVPRDGPAVVQRKERELA